MSVGDSNGNFGSCIFDYTTLANAHELLTTPSDQLDYYGLDSFEHQIRQYEMRCLINLVEALVLQEKILIPFLKSNRLLAILSVAPFDYVSDTTFFKDAIDQKIIDELRINRKISKELISAYEAYANSDAFAEILLNALDIIHKLPDHAELFRITDSSSGTPYLALSDIPDVFTKENFLSLERLLQRRKSRDAYDPLSARLLDGNWIEDKSPFFKPISRFILRGLAYNDIAKIAGTPYTPHPLRVAFSMSEGLWSSNTIKTWGEIALDYMRDFRNDYLANLGGNIFEIDIPLVFASVIRNCKNRQDILSTALEMRMSKPAQAFREWNKNITQAIYTNEGGKS